MKKWHLGGNGDISACGIKKPGLTYSFTYVEFVECKRCKKTKLFKEALKHPDRLKNYDNLK